MTIVGKAITWSGSGAELSLFVVTADKAPPTVTMSSPPYRPKHLAVFPLEDDLRVLHDLHVVEFDARFDAPPTDLRRYVSDVLREAVEAGAVVAWFGFEGSFSFEHLLTPDIADQLYGVADNQGIAVATEDAEIRSDKWRARVALARERLFQVP